MDFELSIEKNFANLPEQNYINDCCVGGDEILNQFKPNISAEMSVQNDSIDINQEDSGWKLRFVKDEVEYLFGISNYNLLETGKTTFSVSVQATKKVKSFFASKTIEAETETNSFYKIVVNIAEKKGFEVN